MLIIAYGITGVFGMVYKEELIGIYRGLDARSKALSEELRQLQKKLPKGSLSLEIKHGRPTFMLNTNHEGKRRRHSLGKAPCTVNDILKSRFLRMQLGAVNKNKARLKACIQSYSSVGSDSFFADLKKRWPHMPYEFIDRLDNSLVSDPWMLEDYEHFNHKDENKRHRTSRGLMVRSKSEVLIAEKLYEHGISFRYEQVLHIGDSTFGPDFTIRRTDGKMFYWEHEGMTQSAEYMRYQTYKNQMYSQAGIVPWDNLIITYDTAYGSVDLRIVESEIRNKLMLQA